MNRLADPTRLAALQQALPARVQAAARAVLDAESRLAQVLAWRAAGQTVNRSDVAVARMALQRAQRDAEDLHRIQGVLPELLKAGGEGSVRLVPVVADADVGD